MYVNCELIINSPRGSDSSAVDSTRSQTPHTNHSHSELMFGSVTKTKQIMSTNYLSILI